MAMPEARARAARVCWYAVSGSSSISIPAAARWRATRAASFSGRPLSWAAIPRSSSRPVISSGIGGPSYLAWSTVRGPCSAPRVAFQSPWRGLRPPDRAESRHAAGSPVRGPPRGRSSATRRDVHRWPACHRGEDAVLHGPPTAGTSLVRSLPRTGATVPRCSRAAEASSAGWPRACVSGDVLSATTSRLLPSAMKGLTSGSVWAGCFPFGMAALGDHCSRYCLHGRQEKVRGKWERGAAWWRPLSQCMSGGVLLSHSLSVAVPSALKGLTSGFGMGPGVSLSLWPP